MTENNEINLDTTPDSLEKEVAFNSEDFLEINKAERLWDDDEEEFAVWDDDKYF